MRQPQRIPIVKRLQPGVDLRLALVELSNEHDISAGVIASMVGSFETAHLRLAGAESTAKFAGPLEIVSATGTIGQSGLHIHLSIADKAGTVYGGHLLEGCIVGSTVELVVVDLSEWWIFTRVSNDKTGYKELLAKPVSGT